ncbi:hypothetical protein BDN71DRAFT_1433887 [Pleurotus eryngii]|uniref:DUF6532 domain-containing protein n=1 Tax=Pleurotus eryngii TaxID=5323 RepID=A0A9P5ZQ67_PLEER|nr:hypothetical protein BDN71DRAFT_1433887 [Pleurotus eryngii]
MHAQAFYNLMDPSDKENSDSGHSTHHWRASEREAQCFQDEVNKAERRARKAEKKVKQEQKKHLQTAASTAALNMMRGISQVMTVASFSPIPLPMLALIFAAIENCIHKWITGIHTGLNFTATKYEVVYQDHLKSLYSFQDHSKHLNILGNICTKLYNTGRFHSGAQPLDNFCPPVISINALNAAIDEYKADPMTETDGENGNISKDSA